MYCPVFFSFGNDYSHVLNQISFRTFLVQTKKKKENLGLCSGPEECKLISSEQNFSHID